MIETKKPVDQLRDQLDLSKPGWEKQVRRDLDYLTPGWESFPLCVWDDVKESWVEVVLLANPEAIQTKRTGFIGQLRNWLRKISH